MEGAASCDGLGLLRDADLFLIHEDWGATLHSCFSFSAPHTHPDVHTVVYTCEYNCVHALTPFISIPRHAFREQMVALCVLVSMPF